MYAGVDEIVDVAAREGIEADIVKGGVLKVARSRPQLDRLRVEVAEDHERGSTDEDIRLLSADDLAERVNVYGAIAAAWSRPLARIQPAKLVRGLADTVERHAVTIYEKTPAETIAPGAVRTPHGTLTAGHVLRAIEGFAHRLPRERRPWPQ